MVGIAETAARKYFWCQSQFLWNVWSKWAQQKFDSKVNIENAAKVPYEWENRSRGCTGGISSGDWQWQWTGDYSSKTAAPSKSSWRRWCILCRESEAFGLLSVECFRKGRAPEMRGDLSASALTLRSCSLPNMDEWDDLKRRCDESYKQNCQAAVYQFHYSTTLANKT